MHYCNLSHTTWVFVMPILCLTAFWLFFSHTDSSFVNTQSTVHNGTAIGDSIVKAESSFALNKKVESCFTYGENSPEYPPWNTSTYSFSVFRFVSSFHIMMSLGQDHVFFYGCEVTSTPYSSVPSYWWTRWNPSCFMWDVLLISLASKYTDTMVLRCSVTEWEESSGSVTEIMFW